MNFYLQGIEPGQKLPSDDLPHARIDRRPPDFDPHWGWDKILCGDGSTHYLRGSCRHLEVDPVESDGNVVAHLCRTCDQQLPAEWRP